jgi:hypothetical protein
VVLLGANMQIFGEETPRTAIPLARYAQLIGYRECAFFGVAQEDNIRSACREIWTQTQREDIRLYLAEAQDEIEGIIQYPLQPTWFSDEAHSINPSHRLMTNYGKIISLGTQATSVISSGAVVDLTIIPNPTITIPFSGTYPLTEIHIFYPDTDLEITPSNIEIVGVNLVISIPKCRLVDYSLLDNPESGHLYTDDSNFQDTVDLKRIYNDSSVQGKLWYRGDICSSFCTESYDSVCGYVKNPEIGAVILDRVTCTCARSYEKVTINYLAGLQKLTRQAETTIIRLAHSKMPTEPCGCDVTQRLWRRDREIPKILTKERIDCPFGMSDGAWIAWKWACDMELKRAGALI